MTVAAARMIAGKAVESIPLPRPAMMFVAAPVVEASAMRFEGPLPSAV